MIETRYRVSEERGTVFPGQSHVWRLRAQWPSGAVSCLSTHPTRVSAELERLRRELDDAARYASMRAPVQS